MANKWDTARYRKPPALADAPKYGGKLVENIVQSMNFAEVEARAIAHMLDQGWQYDAATGIWTHPDKPGVDIWREN